MRRPVFLLMEEHEQAKRLEEQFWGRVRDFASSWFNKVTRYLEDRAQAVVNAWVEEKKRQGRPTDTDELLRDLQAAKNNLKPQAAQQVGEAFHRDPESLLQEGLWDVLEWVGNKVYSVYRSFKSSRLMKNRVFRAAYYVVLTVIGIRLAGALTSGWWHIGIVSALVIWLIDKVEKSMNLEKEDLVDLVDPYAPPLNMEIVGQELKTLFGA